MLNKISLSYLIIYHLSYHIDASYHFTRERISSKEIDVCYVPTGDNTADIMTKGLGRVAYEKHRDSLGVRCC